MFHCRVQLLVACWIMIFFWRLFQLVVCSMDVSHPLLLSSTACARSYVDPSATPIPVKTEAARYPRPERNKAIPANPPSVAPTTAFTRPETESLQNQNYEQHTITQCDDSRCCNLFFFGWVAFVLSFCSALSLPYLTQCGFQCRRVVSTKAWKSWMVLWVRRCRSWWFWRESERMRRVEWFSGSIVSSGNTNNWQIIWSVFYYIAFGYCVHCISLRRTTLHLHSLSPQSSLNKCL